MPVFDLSLTTQFIIVLIWEIKLLLQFKMIEQSLFIVTVTVGNDNYNDIDDLKFTQQVHKKNRLHGKDTYPVLI